MEVGRVGDLRIREWQHCAPPAGRRSAVSIAGRKNLSMKERLKANSASRWSAVGRMVGTTKKNGLTEAGLLMEVARHSPRAPPDTSQMPTSGYLSSGVIRPESAISEDAA